VVTSPNFIDEDLARALDPFATAKLLHFTDVAKVFGGFRNPNHRAEFESWLDQVVQPWCCKLSSPAATPLSREAVAEDTTVHSSSAAAVAPAAAAAGGMTTIEQPTSAPGWSMVAVKARPVA